MSTPDPNIMRWGLHELQGSGYHSNNNTGPSGAQTQDRNENENLGYASMPLRHIEPAPSTTSDALIAQALQEEFQRLDAAGAPGASAPPAQEQVHIFTFGLVFGNVIFFLAIITTILNFFSLTIELTSTLMETLQISIGWVAYNINNFLFTHGACVEVVFDFE